MTETTTKLLRPQAAGLCCSVASLWGEDRMFVYANYGFSDWVGVRAVVPDTHIVDRETLGPVLEILGSKRTQFVARANGIAEIDVSRDQQKQFCLSPKQVSNIAKVARAAEARLGEPTEIEWAYENGALCLLAARPLTASPQ